MSMVSFRAGTLAGPLDARGDSRGRTTKRDLARYYAVVGKRWAWFFGKADNRVILDAIIGHIGSMIADGITDHMAPNALRVQVTEGIRRNVDHAGKWVNLDEAESTAIVDALERAHRLGGFGDEQLRAVGLIPAADHVLEEAAPAAAS